MLTGDVTNILRLDVVTAAFLSSSDSFLPWSMALSSEVSDPCT